MSEIILVRHGEPDLKFPEKINGKEIPGFLEDYDNASLLPDSKPSQKLIFLARNSIVVCSDLKRSVESAKRCGVSPYVTDSVFRESIPPHIRNEAIKLSPGQWLVFSRLFWMAGFSKNGESLTTATKRAKNAAAILTDLAKKKNKRVVLFGHGLFNILIAKELIKNGFEGKKIPSGKHWEYGVYLN